MLYSQIVCITLRADVCKYIRSNYALDKTQVNDALSLLLHLLLHVQTLIAYL